MKQIMMLLAAVLLTCCSSDSEVNAQNNTTMTEKLYITIDGQAQAVTLVDNQATKTLVEKLQQASVTVTLSSSGGFEIWGALGFSLPTSNEQINAQPGDVILYNGSNICIFTARTRGATPVWARLTVCRRANCARSLKLAKATSPSPCRSRLGQPPSIASVA